MVLIQSLNTIVLQSIGFAKSARRASGCVLWPNRENLQAFKTLASIHVDRIDCIKPRISCDEFVREDVRNGFVLSRDMAAPG